MAGKSMSKGGEHDHDKELIELLNELRVALPGVQVMFAFLLIVPFNQGWTKVDNVGRAAYFTAFVATTLASLFFIAPTAHHRLQWRERDKEWLLQIANRSAIVATVLLAIAITAAVFFITQSVFDTLWAEILAVVFGLGFLFYWFLMPLWRNRKT